MSTFSSMTHQSEAVVHREETFEYPWEKITFVEYGYSYNNQEFTGTLIEVEKPDKTRNYYHRIWTEKGKDEYNWKHFLRFQRKFIKSPPYRTQYLMNLGE